MFKRVLAFFSPPTFQDDESDRIAKALHPILLILIGGMIVGLPALLFSTTLDNIIPVLLLILPLVAANIGAYALLKAGRVRAASSIVITLLGIAIFGSYAASSFESVGAGISFILLIALTVLLMDARSVMQLIGLIVVFTLITAIAQANGWIKPVFTTYTDPIQQWVSTAFIYLLSGVMLALATNSLHRALRDARASAQELQNSNRSLVELSATLEERVAARTVELERANATSNQRARQFEAIARVSAEISSAQDLKHLLPRITQAISEQFGFYHVGIFFNDPENQFTVLKAANSEGGQRMLKREHKLKISAQGIVGYVTGSGLPRVAQNVGDDSVYFTNPDLANTLTEMALPLRIGGKTIGALDVQSTESFAVSNEDIASLSILANQVSIAIENARLYESTRKSLEQSESAYRKYVQNEWARFVREENLIGYHYSNGASHPLESPHDLGDAARAVKEGKIYQVEAEEDGAPAQLAVPVKMRGKVVGILHISQPKKARWTDDDIDVVEAVADRLALSVENARLFQVTAGRAARERIVSEFSSRISGNIRMDNILRTAAQELSQALNGSEVLIQLAKHEPASEVQE